MRSITPIDQAMLDKIYELGYRKVVPEDQELFIPFYDRMNHPWSAATAFLNLIAWGDTLPVYFKIEDDIIIEICYESNEGILVGTPFIGHYESAAFKKVFTILKNDFEAIGVPLIIMDVVPWMLPFYEAEADFEVEDLREYQEYIYTADAFEKGMNKQDDRYRYRYFLRKFNSEVSEITADDKEEINAFMKKVWCGEKDCEECQFGCLLDVTGRVLDSFDKLRTRGIKVRVDGELAGFCIATRHNEQGVYQFKHAKNRMKGINEYLLRETYERFFKGVDIINYSEDCGIEGLRKYKMNLCEEYSLLSRLTLREKNNGEQDRCRRKI